MTIEITDAKIHIDTSKVSQLVILPNGFEDNPNSDEYLSSSVSLYKLLKKTVPVQFHSTPESLIELRDSSWIPPAILIAFNLLNENPDALNTLLEAVMNSLKKHSLKEDKPEIDLNIYCETPSGSIKKISYKGPKESLGEVRGIIEDVLSEK